MKKYLKLIRVKHYVKNILVLLPLIFSGRMLDIPVLVSALLSMAAFCLLSSAVYIINDIRDADADHNHPTKSNRPIASGEISKRAALIIAAVLLAAAFAVNSLVRADRLVPGLILFVYLGVNLGYSFGLKNIPILDVAILVSGFMLRVLYGSVVTEIDISGWLYLTVIAMSFYLGLGKRRNELSLCSDTETRPVLSFYSHSFLDKNMYMCLTLAIVFYSLWSVDETTIARLGSDRLVWTVILVVLICMKYSLTVENNSDGDPVEVIFKDKALLAMIALFGAVVMCLIYI